MAPGARLQPRRSFDGVPISGWGYRCARLSCSTTRRATSRPRARGPPGHPRDGPVPARAQRLPDGDGGSSAGGGYRVTRSTCASTGVPASPPDHQFADDLSGVRQETGRPSELIRSRRDNESPLVHAKGTRRAVWLRPRGHTAIQACWRSDPELGVAGDAVDGVLARGDGPVIGRIAARSPMWEVPTGARARMGVRSLGAPPRTMIPRALA